MKTSNSTPFHKFLLIFSVIFLFSSITSCMNNEQSVASEAARDIIVAVVLPCNQETEQGKRFSRIANWYLDNLKASKKRLNGMVDLNMKLEWYDEAALTTDELSDIADKLVSRDDVFAIIGPLYASNLEIFAQKCYGTKKPLIAPCATSENLVRSYAVNVAKKENKQPFLWSLTQTDDAQVEALISKIVGYGGKKVSLISSADIYGRTFFEWLPFISSEYGVEVVQNVRYVSENTGKEYQSGTEAFPLEEAVQIVFSQDTDYVICALSSYKDAETVLQARKTLLKDKNTKILFSDTAFTAELLQYGDLSEGIEGTSPAADPESGFFSAYKARFGQTPVAGEAHFYDALMLCSFAAVKCIEDEKSENPDLAVNAFSNKNKNEALKSFNGSLKSGTMSWDIFGMSNALAFISAGIPMNIDGSTGILDFDSETFTSVLRTVYVHWCVYAGKFVQLDFTTTSEDNNEKTSSTRASWIWNLLSDDTIIEQSINADVIYGDVESKWAVIIAASKGWENYRHQADALYVYQLLKKNGYPDDHIILILQDDIALNRRNKRPGEIFARIDGENLYTDSVEIDYLLSELNPEKVADILCGKTIEVKREQSSVGTANDSAGTSPTTVHEKLTKNPTVLNTDEHANILWFWSGHGANRNGNSNLGQFVWADGKESGFTTELMKSTLTTMKNNHRFRKLLIVTETCYSASIGHVAEGIDGVLVFTAANGSETSLADVFNVDLGVWLTNRFTRNFTENIIQDSSIPFSDLYTYLSKNTIGSHVCMFNASHYDNLYLSSPREFFVY